MQTSQTYLIGKLATFTDESGRTIRQAVLTQNRGVITVPNQATLTSMGLQKAAYGNNLNLLPDGVEVKHSIINQQYYALLMPEAVRYSAGILDYFFRGRLDVSLTWDGVAQNFNLHITNRSGQDLRGGSFLLFGEDASGNRSPVTLTPSPTTGYDPANGLVDGGSVDATFARQVGDSQYLLMFQGTIGSANGVARDPVEGDKAIAAKAFEALPLPQEYWKLEEAAGSGRVGQQTGLILSEYPGSGSVANAPGKIGNAASFINAPNVPALATDLVPVLSDHGIGWTVAGWALAWDSFQTPFDLTFHDSSFADKGKVFITHSGGAFRLEVIGTDDNGTLFSAIAPDALTPGVFYFFRVWFDPLDAKVKVQVNNGTIAESGIALFFPSNP